MKKKKIKKIIKKTTKIDVKFDKGGKYQKPLIEAAQLLMDNFPEPYRFTILARAEKSGDDNYYISNDKISNVVEELANRCPR